MTRKDYELIARAFRITKETVRTDTLDPVMRTAGVNMAAKELAAALSRDNARFNRERFLQACGVEG
jgi:hypothetical protein